MAGLGEFTTITTKVSRYTKFLVRRAMGYVPNLDGSTPTQGEFIEKSAALRATKILRDAGEYDLAKKNYEDLYGPVEEIADGTTIAEVENSEEIEAADDPALEEAKEG